MPFIDEIYGRDAVNKALFDVERARIRMVMAMDGCVALSDHTDEAKQRNTKRMASDYNELYMASLQLRSAASFLDEAIKPLRAEIAVRRQEPRP